MPVSCDVLLAASLPRIRAPISSSLALGLSIPITLVLDNARYQKCVIVTELAQSLEIELLYLLPYSSNLNLIESLPFLLPRLIHIFLGFFKTLEGFPTTLKQLLRQAITVSILELIFVFKAFG